MCPEKFLPCVHYFYNVVVWFPALLLKADTTHGIYHKEGLKYVLVFCREKEYVSKARKILDRILSASESASPRGTTGNPAQARADDKNKVVFVENLEVKFTVKSEKMNPSEFEAES